MVLSPENMNKVNGQKHLLSAQLYPDDSDLKNGTSALDPGSTWGSVEIIGSDDNCPRDPIPISYLPQQSYACSKAN